MSPRELRDAGTQLQARLRAARGHDRDDKARELARAFFPQIAEGVARKYGGRLRREVREDSIARELRGDEPYDVEKELQQRIGREAALRALALAKQSIDAEKKQNTDEEQMKRLVSVSFPVAAKPRLPATGTAPQRTTPPQRPKGRSGGAVER